MEQATVFSDDVLRAVENKIIENRRITVTSRSLNFLEVLSLLVYETVSEIICSLSCKGAYGTIKN